MLRLVALYVPVLFPSWRFFQEVGAGVRLEVSQADDDWVALAPLAKQILPLRALFSLFHNRQWNEWLFAITCAERFLVDRSQQAENELKAQLLRALEPSQAKSYRIVLVDDEGCETVHQGSLGEH